MSDTASPTALDLIVREKNRKIHNAAIDAVVKGLGEHFIIDAFMRTDVAYNAAMKDAAHIAEGLKK